MNYLDLKAKFIGVDDDNLVYRNVYSLRMIIHDGIVIHVEDGKTPYKVYRYNTLGKLLLDWIVW